MLEKLLRFTLVSVVSTASFTFAVEPVDPCEKPASLETTEVDGKTFYKIGSCGDLYKFADMVNNAKGEEVINGKLTKSISVNMDVLKDGDLNTSKSGSFKSWTPIGKNYAPFIGTFDGQGYTVSGLYLDGGLSNLGLFGYIKGAVVKNIGVTDSYFDGENFIGGVVGRNDGGKIENVSNAGVVKGSIDVGGVVGNVGCDGSVCGEVSSSYNSGSVNGQSYVGGVAGSVGKGVAVHDVYNTGDVSGEGTVGGVVGGIGEGSSLSKAYSTGSVSGVNGAGAVVAENSGSVSNVYYNTDKSCNNCNDPDVGDGLPSVKFYSKLPEGFDKDVWVAGSMVIDDDGYRTNGYPYLKSLGEKSQLKVDGGKFEPEGDYYMISTAAELMWFAKRANTVDPAINGWLVNDIVLNENVLDENGKLNDDCSKFIQWTPIGTSDKPYNGFFQGYKFSVSGLFFDDNDADNVGFFGVIGENAYVNGIKIWDSYFNGGTNVGGLAGENKSSNVYDIGFDGVVNGNGNVGGIIGSNKNYVFQFRNLGSVSGGGCVGGLVGVNEAGAEIHSSGNSGSVNGYEAVGGLVGFNLGKIVYSFNVGSVSGSDVVGGLIGYNEGGEVSSVYNAGSVDGNMSGAIVGLNEGTITNSYYNVDFPCEKCSVIEGVGLTTAQLASGQLPEGFDNNWYPGKTSKENDGTVTFMFPDIGIGMHVVSGSLIAESADSGKVLLENGITVYAPAVLFPEKNDQSVTVFGYSKGPAATKNLKNATVEYKRTFAAVGENLYSTVMFPFSAAVPAGIKVSFHKFSGMKYKDEKWQIVVDGTKATDLTANIPYLVKVEEGETVNSITFGGADFEVVNGGSKSVLMSEGSPWNLVGTYEYKDWKTGDKGLGKVYGFAGSADNVPEKVGKFGKVGAGAYIYPMRVYLEYDESKAPASVRSLNGAKAPQGTLASLPETIDVVMENVDAKDSSEKTTVIGTINTRTGEFKAASDRYFDLKGRNVGKKPAAKGSFYNKKKIAK